MSERVDFTRSAAERIANVVRTVESTAAGASPLRFGKVVDGGGGGSGVRLGSFTGSWPIDELKQVTLAGSTNTVLVLNATLPLDIKNDSPNTAARTVLFSQVQGTYHAVEIEQGGVCGSFKEYLVTLEVQACHGEGAIAIVRDVNIGTTPAPNSDSGPGAISSIDVLSVGSGYVKRGREQPTVGVSASSTNVTFSLSYSEHTEACNLPYWKVSGITASGPTADFTPQSLTVAPLNSATEVVKASLQLTTAGASVVDGGKYYRESNALPVYTQTASIFVLQGTPSNGGGASLTPVFETDPTKAAFGQLKSVSIVSGGTGYIAWKWSGSVMLGNLDLSSIENFKAYEKQVLGHEGACLKWFDMATCAG